LVKLLAVPVVCLVKIVFVLGMLRYQYVGVG
jgi:hypothetical protein